MHILSGHFIPHKKTKWKWREQKNKQKQQQQQNNNNNNNKKQTNKTDITCIEFKEKILFRFFDYLKF